MLAWLAIAAATTYLVFIGGAWAGLYTGALRLLSVGIAVAAIAAWATVAWRRPEWRPRSGLIAAIVACLGSLGTSTIFSTNPRVSLDFLAYGFILAAVYMLLVRLMAMPFYRSRLIALARLLFTAIAFAFLAQSVVHWATWLTVLGRWTVPPLRPEYESLTFGSPQGVVAILALLAVPVVASLDWATIRGKVGVGAVALIVGLAGLISGSRGAWLALTVAAVAATAWIAWAYGRGGASALRVRCTSGRGRVVLAAVLGALVVATVAVGPSLVGRLSAGGESSRFTFAATAFRLFVEHPLVGSGPGTWAIERIRLTRPSEVDDYQPHAHDLYLQTLAELGVGGALAGIAIAVAIGLLLYRGLRGSDLVIRRWAAASTIGALYFLTHQIVDFWVNMPALLFAVAIPVAYLDARSAPQDERRPACWRRGTARNAIVAVAGTGLVVSIAWIAIEEVRAIRYDQAIATYAADQTAVDRVVREIADSDPGISSYAFTAGLTADRSGDHETAAAYFQQVAQHDDLPEAWLNLGAEQLILGDRAGARGSLEAAFRLGFQRPAIAMPLGDLALQNGDRDLAHQAFAAAIQSAPSLAADPWWNEDPVRRNVFEAVVQALVAPGPSSGWEVALMHGDGTLAATLGAGQTVEVTLFIDAWLGDGAATSQLYAACRSDPLDIPSLLLCARIAHRNGNETAAYDFRYLANAQIQESFLSGSELRIASTQSDGSGRAGGLATAWGTYTYRRATPHDMLVTSVVHLRLE